MDYSGYSIEQLEERREGVRTAAKFAKTNKQRQDAVSEFNLLTQVIRDKVAAS